MANGSCPIGATNAANILAQGKRMQEACEAMEKMEERTDKRVSRVEAKQDWMIYLLIGNLVAVLIGYIT